MNLTSYSRLFEGIFYKKLPIFTQFSFQKSPNFHHFFSNQPFYKFGEGIVNEDNVIIIVERKGERRALLVKQLAYHHLSQGELAGEPYLVSF